MRSPKPNASRSTTRLACHSGRPAEVGERVRCRLPPMSLDVVNARSGNAIPRRVSGRRPRDPPEPVGHDVRRMNAEPRPATGVAKAECVIGNVTVGVLHVAQDRWLSVRKACGNVTRSGASSGGLDRRLKGQIEDRGEPLHLVCEPFLGRRPSFGEPVNRDPVVGQRPRPGHDSAVDHDIGPTADQRPPGRRHDVRRRPCPDRGPIGRSRGGGGPPWSVSVAPGPRDARAGRTRAPRRCRPPRGDHRSRRSRPGSACAQRPGLPRASTAGGRASPARTRRSTPRPHASRPRRARARPPSEGCRSRR